MTPPVELIDDLRILQPPNPWLIYYWAGGAALGLLILLFGLKMFRRWRQRRAAGSNIQIRAAQEEALSALEQLFSVVEAGQAKAYAIESSAILRRYVEQRFEIRAPQKSTEEFLREAQHSSQLSPELQELIASFLGCCDFLKFGRGIATRDELEALHAAAIQLVSETPAEEIHGRGS